MSSINKTPHYNLSQFGDSPDDRPSWRGDYTGDMSKIDSQMYRNETDATTATSTANTAKNTADNALELAQANKGDIAEQESYFTALGVTSEPTAQALMSTINGKAENTALTALRGTVSALSGRVDGKADASQVYTKAQADTTFVKQGGYSGTAQELNSAIGGVSSSFEQFKEDGQAPISIGTQTQPDSYSGLKVMFSAYYSPLTHLVVIRGGLHGTTTSTLAAGAHQLGSIDQMYAPVNYDFQAICDYNFGDSNDGARLEIKKNGTVQLRNWAQVKTGQPIDADACVSYYALLK
jgi:hypothetical protein|nr:MAG TPA: hypothetical protein [Caudoviricetes sp.]